MSTAIKRRRGTTAQHTAFTGLLGEITVDTDKRTAVVHDGITPGGFPLARDLVVYAKTLGAAGDGLTDDSAVFQTLLDNLPEGVRIHGADKTYAIKQLNVSRRIHLSNVKFTMLGAAVPGTTQKAINITAADVRIIDCDITIGVLANVLNASGIYGDGCNNLQVIRGKYIGSINDAGSYTAGNYHCPIFIKNASNVVIEGVFSDQATLEGIYLHTCTDSLVYASTSNNAGNSGVSIDKGERCTVAHCNVVGSGASGLSVNGSLHRVLFNTILDSKTNGIVLGHAGAGYLPIGNLCMGNVIKRSGKSTTYAFLYASIIVQGADMTEVCHNTIEAPIDNTAFGKVCHGIFMTAASVSAHIHHNRVNGATGNGIYLADPTNESQVDISDNWVVSSYDIGIAVAGCLRASVRRNHVLQSNRKNTVAGYGIYVGNGATSGNAESIDVIDNEVLDTTPQQRYGVYVFDNFAAAFILRLHGNKIRGWVTKSIVSNRAIIYDSRGNDYNGTARSGTVVATVGATTSIVCGQVMACDQPIVMPANNAAVALPLVPTSFVIADGAFDIRHAVATGAETLRWYLP